MIDELGAHVPIALPELDPLEEREEDDLPLDEETSLLPGAAADEGGLDDAVADEVDPGVRLHEPTDEGDTEEAGDLAAPLDAGLLTLAPDASPEDDEAGVGDVALDLGGEPELAAGTADPEGAADGSLEALVEGALPELDDGSDDSDGGLDPDALELEGAARDDPRPAPASSPWAATTLTAEGAPTAVCAVAGAVLAAGRTFSWRPPRDPPPPAPSTPIEALAVGPDGTVLAACSTGELVRLERGQTELSTISLRAATSGADHVAQVSVVGAWWPRVLIRTSAGEIWSSDDGGLRFTPLELRARVLELTGTESAAFALAEDRAGRTLLHSVDGGRVWRSLPLDEAARRVGGGAAPSLAAAGAVVAIADPERGLAVSADGGASFCVVSGCASVSAIAAGQRQGTARVWIALRDELESRSWLVEVDVAAGTATTLAQTPARIDALARDDTTDIVYAVGADGLSAWRPERGD